MSVLVDTQSIEDAEPVLSGDEMYQRGLTASLAGEGGLGLIDAHKWFNLAAMQGNQEARIYRSELASEMSTEQIAEAQRQAREYLKRHRPKLAS